jgi:hypothetical protein
VVGQEFDTHHRVDATLQGWACELYNLNLDRDVTAFRKDAFHPSIILKYKEKGAGLEQQKITRPHYS